MSHLVTLPLPSGLATCTANQEWCSLLLGAPDARNYKFASEDQRKDKLI